MLVILTNDHIFSAKQVCQGCLLADRQGLPRWHHGQPTCAHSIGKPSDNQPVLYECEMGFRVADVESSLA